MGSKTIQKILEDAAKKKIFFDKSADSMKWFYERARRTRGITSSTLIREFDQKDYRVVGQNYPTQVHPGGMYMYFYDPLHKATLPYYDRFPCIFLTDFWERADGTMNIAGINLHYLPYKQRALLMDALYDLENNSKLDANKRLKISYGILKHASNTKWFRPCYKRYINTHIKSRLVKVPYEEWKVACFLPVAEFEKKTQNEVWKESLRKSK